MKRHESADTAEKISPCQSIFMDYQWADPQGDSLGNRFPSLFGERSSCEPLTTFIAFDIKKAYNLAMGKQVLNLGSR